MESRSEALISHNGNQEGFFLPVADLGPDGHNIEAVCHAP
jgi:hypothetical protein